MQRTKIANADLPARLPGLLADAEAEAAALRDPAFVPGVRATGAPAQVVPAQGRQASTGHTPIMSLSAPDTNSIWLAMEAFESYSAGEPVAELDKIEVVDTRGLYLFIWWRDC